MPTNLLAGSLADSQARQIHTEIYFPRALGISALITAIHASPSQSAPRASASLKADHFLFIPGRLLYVLGFDHGNRAGDGADLFDSSGVGFHL